MDLFLPLGAPRTLVKFDNVTFEPQFVMALEMESELVSKFVANLEGRLRQSNPAALQLLHTHVGNDLKEVQLALHSVIPAVGEHSGPQSASDLPESSRRALPLAWNPHAGDNEVI